MQSIVTKYIGPTNTKGARIKATSCGGFSVTVPFDYEGNEHETAARELCKKLKWEFSHVPGELPDGSTAWVFVSRPRLADRLRSIADGEFWDSSDLQKAISYCTTNSERDCVLNHLKGDSGMNDRLGLYDLASKIDCIA
jgi:hypothetical protein